MAITLNPGRQYPLSARVAFSGVTADAEVLAIDVYPAILLPAGAILTGGYVAVKSVFTATCDLDIGDADPDRYTPTIVPADALGATKLVPDGVPYAVETWINVSLVTSATIIGAGELVVEYIMQDRANEVVPT